MLKKVAVNKNEIYSLLRMNKYDEALKMIKYQKTNIENTALEIVNKYVKNEIILIEEKETFIKIIEKDINDKLIKDYSYILMDEDRLFLLYEKINTLRRAKSLN